MPDPEGVLEKLEVPREGPTVDMCCGDIYFKAPLARLVAPARLYALELDPEILEGGQRVRGRTGRYEPCVLVQDDARNIAQRTPALLGFALIANTSHGVPDKTALTPAWFTKYWDQGAGWRPSTSIP